MKKFLQALFTSSITLFSMQLSASNLKWLEYSPVRRFTEEDWDMAKSTAKTLMDAGNPNESADWSNAATGNGGKFTILETSEKDGTTCHSIRIENYSKTMRGGGTYLFCKQPDGSWKSPQAKL